MTGIAIYMAILHTIITIGVLTLAVTFIIHEKTVESTKDVIREEMSKLIEEREKDDTRRNARYNRIGFHIDNGSK